MNLENLLNDLSTSSEQNSTLNLLESIIVDNDQRIIDNLTKIINDPSSIENTNRFASLLEYFSAEEFISPLVNNIRIAQVGNSRWLADYMYALGSILMEREEYLLIDDDFVHVLGKWLLSTGGGEISWKAGVILSELNNPTTKQYLIKGASDDSLFHQTRIACIRGIINHYRSEASTILQQLSDDSDKYVREAVNDAKDWLKNHSLK